MPHQANPTPSDSEPLAGTVKPYHYHLALCTGGPAELWAARVEEMEGLFDDLNRALREAGMARAVKLTACDHPTLSEEGVDIFLMPDMLRLPAVTPERVPMLVEALATRFEQGLPFAVEPMAGGDHLFVCTHNNRDERCGTHGTAFYVALQEAVLEQNAIAYVHRSSHIGGHRFAATCIIYPQGIWYGELRPEDAPRLVAEHLNRERLLPDRYRGRMDASSCQQVAEAEAARVLLGAYAEYESLEVRVEEDEEKGTAVAHARALVRGPGERMVVRADFALSCPLIWWSADDDPIFLDDL